MGEMQRILAGIATVNEKVDKLIKWQAAMGERCENHRRDTDGVRTVLYGTKEDGLVSDVQRLKNCKETIKQSVTYWKSFVFGVLRTLVSTTIILVVMWLAYMWKTHGTS